MKNLENGLSLNWHQRWTGWMREIDHVQPICLFDKIKDEELKDAFNWKNTQPLLKHDHQQKGIKYKVLNYQLQFLRAYQLIN